MYFKITEWTITVGRQISSLDPALRSFVSNAFEILEGLSVCDRTFPLFILGCEAETDVQRAIILRISKQTETEYFSSIMSRIRGYIETFWPWKDLDVEGVVGHSERMAAAVSAQSSPPSFL